MKAAIALLEVYQDRKDIPMENKIIELLQQGDERAIELLVKHYERLIRYVASTILRGYDSEIDECINDVYLKIWKYGADYDESKSTLVTYINMITRSVAINHLRSVIKIASEQESGDSELLMQGCIDHSQDVEQGLISREDIQILGRMIRSLNERDKEIIIRRFYHMQSIAEIASEMGMSENAVYTRLSRLRKNLKKRFEKESKLPNFSLAM